MLDVTTASRTDLVTLFRQTLAACESLYRRLADECVRCHPQLVRESATDFVEGMVDLHRALLLKICLETAQADLRLSAGEHELAGVLLAHVSGESQDRASRMPIDAAIEAAGKLSWGAVLAPFSQYPPFARATADLSTIAMRAANIVARIEGEASPETQAQLKATQYQLWQHLHREHAPPRAAKRRDVAESSARQFESSGRSDLTEDSPAAESRTNGAPVDKPPTQERPQLDLVMQELDSMIGLAPVKAEVLALVNYLKLNARRREAGLPETPLSLHMVFLGNPGTGKTTVARLVGRIFAALGVLERGHLVETDRTGLVAEYVGQTGPKSNRKIDEALGGVLFIDEAYSLANGDDDVFGAEAVQALLKRAEDDRHQLVVILAGYDEPMARLLASNPGLTSRFARKFDFPDYDPEQLGQILDGFCRQHHYRLATSAEALVRERLKDAWDERDERFGNARLVRNLFEEAVRRMANRVAGLAAVNEDDLTRFEPADFE